MELHALDTQCAVAQAHNFAILRGSRHGKAGRYGCALDHEGVIARRDEVIRDLGEHAGTVMPYERRLAVHDRTCAHDLCAKSLPDGLVPETNPQDGYLSGETADQGKRDAGFVRRTRAWGQDDMGRLHLLDRIERD